jgi:hypothetical protein
MNKSKRIFVYTEDTPVHRNVVAKGLRRAGTPILRSIRDYIDGIVIYPIGKRYEHCDLDLELAPLCDTLPRFTTLLCKAMRRYPVLDWGLSDALPPRMLAREVRRSTADILFAFVGSDYGMLKRASRLAALAQKSSVFYVVDDFLASLQNSGAKKSSLQKAEKEARIAFSVAKHVFTITDGLGEYLHDRFGVFTSTLSLAFEPEPRPAASLKKQIIYVGSINFLYAEGLRDLFKAVEGVRRASGVDLRVRLTVSAELAALDLGTLPSFVVAAPAESSIELATEIASSLFAFLPYSFNSREKAMVTTSFPSKSMEYLAYARSIVVYGPDYGVSTKLFQKSCMPSVVSSPAALEDMTRMHLKESPEYFVQYRKYLATAHSLEAARKTICRDLGLGND